MQSDLSFNSFQGWLYKNLYNATGIENKAPAKFSFVAGG
jgi:hypothetical protein